MTATSKTAAFGELRARLYARGLELYEEPTLIGELRRLRARHTAGQAAVVNPRVGGSHGDLAQALALAVWEQGRRGAGPVDGYCDGDGMSISGGVGVTDAGTISYDMSF